MKTATIFDLQRFSVNNGPGIRSTVFFKGCPLRCQWCHNPESFTRGKQLMIERQFCRKCGKCAAVCPNKAIDSETLLRDMEKCKVCGKCSDVCNWDAIKLVGEEVTVDDLVGRLKRDRMYYIQSGGGVTLSGGEPTLQYEFLSELMDVLRNDHIHVALDTCGFCEENIFLELAKKADLLLFDLKCMEEKKHKRLTGQFNAPILKNLVNAVEHHIAITIRYPLIPGANDSEDDLREFSKFVTELGIEGIEVSPYHDLGRNKYEALMMKPPISPELYTDQQLERKISIMNSYGLMVTKA